VIGNVRQVRPRHGLRAQFHRTIRLLARLDAIQEVLEVFHETDWITYSKRHVTSVALLDYLGKFQGIPVQNFLGAVNSDNIFPSISIPFLQSKVIKELCHKVKEIEPVMDRVAQGFSRDFRNEMKEGREIYEKLKPHGFPVLIKDHTMTYGLGAIDRVEVRKIEKKEELIIIQHNEEGSSGILMIR
jgi:L-alanine-DL-glutamate epimerase-like enolase superfamily enzyme